MIGPGTFTIRRSQRRILSKSGFVQPYLRSKSSKLGRSCWSLFRRWWEPQPFRWKLCDQCMSRKVGDGSDVPWWCLEHVVFVGFPVLSGEGIVEMLKCVGLVPKSGIGFVHFGYKQFPFTKVSIIPTWYKIYKGNPQILGIFMKFPLFFEPNYFSIWVFPNIGVPQNGRVIMENPHLFNGWFGGYKFSIRNRSRLLDALGLGLADGISFGATVNACDRASQWEVAIELVTEMQRRRMQQNLGACEKKSGGKVVDRTVTKGECSVLLFD